MKDNISIAGVPMMNGSRLLEGYSADVDATVVSRILDAGGTITGKAVCEEWCFTAPVVLQPLGLLSILMIQQEWLLDHHLVQLLWLAFQHY